MKLPLTLSYYLIRQFLWSFFIVFSVFTVLIILIDAVELLRRASGRDIPFYVLLEMVILKFPLLIQTIMPFIILVSSVLTYTSLARKQELVVIRSAGVSAWEFLMPNVVIAFALGVFAITIFNPIACIMLSRFELLEARYFYNKQNLMEISDQGLWIRQEIDVRNDSEGNEDEEASGEEGAGDTLYNVIIHAEEVTGEKEVMLTNVSAFGFTADDIFSYRVDSESARLREGSWSFNNARITFTDGRNEEIGTYKIPTNVDSGDIQKSFSDPQTISFWELPNFISKLNKTGFSDISHSVHYQKLLSSPFFYAVMVLIGALFSLRAPRQGNRVGYAVSFSVVLGFVIYFISNLVSSIGLSGSLPVSVASWSPVFLTGFFGFLVLLYLEDG